MTTITDNTPVSPELAALRKEANIWGSIFSVMANATIKAAECKQAQDILDRLQVEVTRSVEAVEARVAIEEAAKPKPPVALVPDPVPSAPVIPDLDAGEPAKAG